MTKFPRIFNITIRSIMLCSRYLKKKKKENKIRERKIWNDDLSKDSFLTRYILKNVSFFLREGRKSWVREFFNRFSATPEVGHIRGMERELPLPPPPPSLVVAASKTFKSRLLNVTKRSSCQFRGIFKPLLPISTSWDGVGEKKKRKKRGLKDRR